VLSGLNVGEQIVTAGSFLVDAETRLNPAAGSIYFGGSGSGKVAAGGSAVRATTPEDPEAKIAAALAALSPADRQLAQQQRTCVILPGSRLGSMGPPVRLTLDGETVFLCCSGCKTAATSDPAKSAAKAKVLQAAGKASPINPPAGGR